MYKYKLKNLPKYTKKALYVHHRNKLLTLIILSLIILTFGITLMMGGDSPLLLVGVIILAFGIAIPFAFVVRMNHLTKQAIDSNKKYYAGEHEVQLEYDYIRVLDYENDSVIENRFYYDRIWKILMNADLMMIYLGYNKYICLPHEDLVEGNFEDLITYLENATDGRVFIKQL